MKYQVFGVDPGGKRTLVSATRFAREARSIRDRCDGRWAGTVVVGSEGELTALQLDQLAELHHQYV